MKLSYLTVPVRLKYYVLKDFSISAGMQYNYLVNSSVRATEDAIEDDGVEIKKGILAFPTKESDLGAVLGIEYYIGNVSCFADFYKGFFDLYKDSNIRNMSFSLGLAFTF